MKVLGNIFLYTAITFGLLQLIKIDIPSPPKSLPEDKIIAPQKVMALLEKSCFNCHSNTTNWPWYSNIAPVSFSVRGHVKDGRSWLNYDVWNKYTTKEQQERLEQTVRTLQTRQMPIPTYLWAHKEARLSDTQRELLIDWAKSKITKE